MQVITIIINRKIDFQDKIGRAPDVIYLGFLEYFNLLNEVNTNQTYQANLGNLLFTKDKFYEMEVIRVEKARYLEFGINTNGG